MKKIVVVRKEAALSSNPCKIVAGTILYLLNLLTKSQQGRRVYGGVRGGGGGGGGVGELLPHHFLDGTPYGEEATLLGFMPWNCGGGSGGGSGGGGGVLFLLIFHYGRRTCLTSLLCFLVCFCVVRR
ncbi:hypothetical protein PIB30_033730 [Stylosanthes scabra]|uniref:Uncharacterized protein n=1 Tax=Stylosanthes scabra TaxID=79078 RepID=A0ABU6Z9E0_9FABA|nr:hypothetical protein [Stylosanthes scabra]